MRSPRAAAHCRASASVRRASAYLARRRTRGWPQYSRPCVAVRNVSRGFGAAILPQREHTGRCRRRRRRLFCWWNGPSGRRHVLFGGTGVGSGGEGGHGGLGKCAALLLDACVGRHRWKVALRLDDGAGRHGSERALALRHRCLLSHGLPLRRSRDGLGFQPLVVRVASCELGHRVVRDLEGEAQHRLLGPRSARDSDSVGELAVGVHGDQVSLVIRVLQFDRSEAEKAGHTLLDGGALLVFGGTLKQRRVSVRSAILMMTSDGAADIGVVDIGAACEPSQYTIPAHRPGAPRSCGF